ncbi:MAG: MotA/TolQ/ExbB proton channel family protein, partial [bacterium]
MAIIFYRFVTYGRIKSKDRKFISRYNNMNSLQEIGFNKSGSPLENICNTGIKEYNNLVSEMLQLSKQNIKTPTMVVENHLTIIRDALEESVSFESLKNHALLVHLAIVSSISPFLGLLGTVWGIMLAFMRIDRAGSA